MVKEALKETHFFSVLLAILEIVKEAKIKKKKKFNLQRCNAQEHNDAFYNAALHDESV